MDSLDEVSYEQNKINESYRIEVDNANKNAQELIKQLILVATIFLSASVFIFQIPNIANCFPIFFKLLIIFSWIALVFSMFFGIAQIYIDSNYHKKRARIYASVLSKFSDGKLLSVDAVKHEMKSSALNDEDGGSSSLCGYAQLTFLAIGVLFFLIAISGILLSL